MAVFYMMPDDSAVMYPSGWILASMNEVLSDRENVG
jgi:hypothetical protein